MSPKMEQILRRFHEDWSRISSFEAPEAEVLFSAACKHAYEIIQLAKISGEAIPGKGLQELLLECGKFHERAADGYRPFVELKEFVESF